MGQITLDQASGEQKTEVDVPCSLGKSETVFFELTMNKLALVWTLTGPEDLLLNGKILKAGKCKHLQATQNRLVIGNLMFDLRFVISTVEQQKTYVKDRCAIIRERSFEGYWPSSSWSGLPLEGDICTKTAILRANTSSQPSETLHGMSLTGRPVKAAVIKVDNMHDLVIFNKSIDFHRRLSNAVGLAYKELAILHGGDRLLPDRLPQTLLIIGEEGTIPFHKIRLEYWSRSAVDLQKDIKKELARRLLLGLQHVHNADFILRDIAPDKIAVSRYSGPHFDDFSSTSLTKTSDDLTVFTNLPPECEYQMSGNRFALRTIKPTFAKSVEPYNQLIDEFMLAATLTPALFSKSVLTRKDAKNPTPNCPKYNPYYPEDLEIIRHNLRNERHPVADLLFYLLEPNPKKRLSATKALDGYWLRDDPPPSDTVNSGPDPSDAPGKASRPKAHRRATNDTEEADGPAMKKSKIRNGMAKARNLPASQIAPAT